MSSCLFFIFSNARPPPSTLFPYTTLFRSLYRMAVRRRLLEWTTAAHTARALSRGSARRLAWVEIDRKSTRLNSSHVRISYAVFCLKKKKKKKNRGVRLMEKKAPERLERYR